MNNSKTHHTIVRNFAAIMTLIFALLLAGGPVRSKATTVRDATGSSLADADILLYTAKGDGVNNIAYAYSDAGNYGPESFAVENGSIFLLDSVNSRLLINNEGQMQAVSLEGCSYPTHMCVEDGTIIISDNDSESILICDESGVNSSVALPDDLSTKDIYRIHPLGNNRILMLTHDLNQYLFDISSKHWSYASHINVVNDGKGVYSIMSPELNNSVQINCGSDAILQYISATNNMLFVGVYDFVPDVSIIMTEHVIKAIHSDGSLIGCTVIDTNEACSYPNDETYISTDGVLYVMHCNNDGVYITRPNLRKEYSSSMGDLATVAFELETMNRKTSIRSIQQISFKRSQVLSRAYSAAYHNWTISAANKTIPAQYSSTVTLPAYVNAASPGNTLTGIPYAWGRMVTSIADFDNKISSDYIAGNINKSTDYGVSITTGMDCSGFVSYAYGFTTHFGSGQFYSFGYPVYSTPIGSNANSGAFSNMKSMDFLVKWSSGSSWNHVILFNSVASSSTVQVYESLPGIYNNVNIGKVIANTRNISELSGYYRRSPYPCTSSGCSGSSYSSNDYYHWQTCSTCGATCNYSTHTWVSYGTGYRCSVCGKTTSSIPQPTKLIQGCNEHVCLHSPKFETD